MKKIPLGISGLSLSVAALGNLLGGAARPWLGLLAAVLWALWIGKVATDFPKVWKELKQPIPLSLSVTGTMALMVLAAYLRPFMGALALILWFMGMVAQLGVMGLFALRFMSKLKLATVFPSWLVLGVGIAVASLTSPAMGFVPLGQLLFWVGFALYFLMMGLVIARLIKIKELPEPARPTLAIVTAPMSLLVVGYLATHSNPSAPLLWVMTALAGAGYGYALYRIIPQWRMKFYPTMAAYTFPLVISASAFSQVGNVLNFGNSLIYRGLVGLMTGISILTVGYVLVRYWAFLMPKPLNFKKQPN